MTTRQDRLGLSLLIASGDLLKASLPDLQEHATKVKVTLRYMTRSYGGLIGGFVVQSPGGRFT